MKMNRLARAKDLMTKVVNLAVEKLTNWTYKTTGATTAVLISSTMKNVNKRFFCD